MKKIMIIFILSIALICPAFSQSAGSDVHWSIFQLALLDEFALPPMITDVYGLRINLVHGSVNNMSGLDIGLSQNVAGKMAGLQFGILFSTADYFMGLQLSTVNYAKNISQFSFQSGILNMASKNDGFQLGCVNISSDFSNAQVGVWNNAANIGFMQLGLINFSNKDLDGFQIGLLNFGPTWFFPIINWNPYKNNI